MELKTLGIRRKWMSAKRKIFQAIRPMGFSGKDYSSGSPPDSLFPDAQYETAEWLTNRSLQVELFILELRRAEAVQYWRVCIDRPK